MNADDKHALNLMINEVVNRKGSALLINLGEFDRTIAERLLGIMANLRVFLKEKLSVLQYIFIFVILFPSCE